MEFEVRFVHSADQDLKFYSAREHMKKIDLTEERRSLSEVLTFAKSEAVLIHSASGEDFVLESADEFDREVAALSESEQFTSFLDARAKESHDIPLGDVRRKRGM